VSGKLLLESAVDERTVGGGPAVGIIMGSNSDWKTMRPAAQVLDELGVRYEARVVSAHRTPDDLYKYAKGAESLGLSLIIAGAGGAAHLPGMTASMTLLPVVGIPVIATPLNGLDALLSIMQMPAEVGVATMSVGERGAERAGVFAAVCLAVKYPWLRARLRVLRTPTLGGATPTEGTGKVAILSEDGTCLEVLRHTEDYLSRLEVPYEKVVVGLEVPAGGMAKKVANLEAKGTTVFIAGSGLGFRFACDVANSTALPVLGVPVVTEQVRCVDHFLQPFLEMPPGLATFAIGRPGAINAALFAATILSGPGTGVWEKLHKMRDDQITRVRAMKIEPVREGHRP
jgi:5-(carboxyamino)imidazole ribonucleotide mutase